MDTISKLPVSIIETILCLLPIQEAARTSILSKEWRYHWTKIPKLVFIENQFQVSTDRTELSVLEQTFGQPSKRKKMDKRCKFFYAIYQVLLIHQGPIHEFTLDMEVDASCVEIDHIILHLSKKITVKKLKLDFTDGGYEGYMLPISLFSLHQLTDMYIGHCGLFHERSFNELGCLTTLYLSSLWTSEKTLLRLLSSCPLLKRLTLHCGGATIFEEGIEDTPIVDLFKCLPVIEYLFVSFFIVKCFAPERLPKELPAALVHLKHLCMHDVCFSHIYGLPFLALLIRSSPNLEKLELMTMYDEPEEDEMGSFTLEDYSDIILEHLNEFEFRRFTNADDELDFVKLILARSPVLKKVSIFPCCEIDEDEKAELSKTLSLSPFASPAVEIII